MVTLIELPNELIRCIAEFLPSGGLFSLRQSCQAMNTMTFDIFIRDHFQTRYIMLEHRSIENLKAISEDPILRLAVRALGLCTEHLVDSDDDGLGCEHDLPLGETWGVTTGLLQADSDNYPPWLEDSISEGDDASINTCAACTHRQRMSEQEAFRSGRDRACLVQAMRNLPNCKTLILTDAHVPWGAARLEREVDSPLSRGVDQDSGYLEEEDFVKHVLDTMLIAAAESELPIEGLDVYLGHMDEPKCVQPMIVQLLDAPAELKLASLTSLRLILCPWPGDEDAPDWEPGFARFLDMFPQLLHLTLAFDGEEQYDDHTLFPQLSRVLSIPHLQVVDLARFEVTVSELAEMLLRHQATLREITLREVKLRGIGSWPFLLEILWNMSGVHRLTMKNCLIEDEWIPDNCGGMPDAVSIVDERTFSEAIGWIDEATEWILSQGLEEFSATDSAVQNPLLLSRFLLPKQSSIIE